MHDRNGGGRMVYLVNQEITLTHGGDIYSAREKLSLIDNPPKILDFSANINPLGLPEGVKQAIKNSIDHFSAYPDPLCRELISSLSGYEGVPKDWIFCGNGAADIIYRLVYTKKPKKALILAPTFAEYEEALNEVFCEVVLYELKEEKNFLIDESLLEVMEKDLDMLFLCNPNNPTGQLIPKEIILKVLKRCKVLGIQLILDECFNEFLEEPEKYSSKEYVEEFDNLFILRAFTKIYAMAGIRLGHCISSDTKLLKEIMQAGQPWSVSTIAQIAGIQATEEKEYLIRAKQLIGEERKYLIRSFEDLGISVISSNANYIFIKNTLPKIKQLHEELFEKGILIRNCENYHGLGPGYYRICIKKHEENIELITALNEIKSCR